MEAHNCECAGVHVPCEIVMRLGDLGAEYVWEQQASFSAPGLRDITTATTNPLPPIYCFEVLVLDGEIGAARSPASLWKCLIFRLEKVGKTEPHGCLRRLRS